MGEGGENMELLKEADYEGETFVTLICDVDRDDGCNCDDYSEMGWLNYIRLCMWSCFDKMS